MSSPDSQRIEFASLNDRTVTSDFEGGQITSDGGVTLLGEVFLGPFLPLVSAA